MTTTATATNVATTGNEVVGSILAKLISVGDVRALNNEAKTPYRYGTIEVVDGDGVVTQQTARIWEKNFQQGMENGKSYLTNITEYNGKAYFAMSHLSGSSAPAMDINAAKNLHGFRAPKAVQAAASVNPAAL